MRLLLFVLIVLPLIQCSTDQVDYEAVKSELDSLNVNTNTFNAVYVSTDGRHFQERSTYFELADSSLTVRTGDCPMVYRLYEGGAKGATLPKTWNTSGYVEHVSIKVERFGRVISSIKLNDHYFTNTPIPLEEEVVVVTAKTYIIKKGDTVTKLRKFIPIDKLPKNLIINHKIMY